MSGQQAVTVGGGVAAFIAAFGLIFRETVGWFVGKLLDLLPLPKTASGVVNWDAVPWLNMLAIALLALGVYLFYRGGRMQTEAVKTTSDPTPGLTSEAYRIARMIEAHRATRSLYRDRLPNLIPMVREGIATLISFGKAGFAVPNFVSNDAYRIAVGLEHYFGAIAPLLSSGHTDVAKRDASQIAKASENLCANFKPDGWWTSNDW